MGIDKALYLAEMRTLLRKARQRWMKRFPEIEIYSINVWTYPATCTSAINLDTREHSKTTVAHAKRFARHQRAYAIREGNKELARLFDRWKKIARETNPTEFAFPQFVTTGNQSFDAKWAKSARCWPALGPLLQNVRDMAAEAFAETKLHRDAEVSVNGEKNWCEGRRRIRAGKTKRKPGRS